MWNWYKFIRAWWARRRPGLNYVIYVFVFLDSIIICQLFLTLAVKKCHKGLNLITICDNFIQQLSLFQCEVPTLCWTTLLGHGTSANGIGCQTIRSATWGHYGTSFISMDVFPGPKGR